LASAPRAGPDLVALVVHAGHVIAEIGKDGAGDQPHAASPTTQMFMIFTHELTS
jgi:hypothetical protein